MALGPVEIKFYLLKVCKVCLNLDSWSLLKSDLLEEEQQKIYYFSQPQGKTTYNVIKTFSLFIYSRPGNCVLASPTATAAKISLCFRSTSLSV